MKLIDIYFGYMKSIAIFAMSYNVDGKRKPAKIAGIFYALAILLITAVTPVWSVNAPTAIDWCKTTGKDSRFSCPTMPNNVLQMAGLILSKESSASEIKRYFNAVLELSKSDNEFPINLDEVWMLVYAEKGKAVRALEENFIKDVDYQVFAQNGKNPLGGRPTNEYRLSPSCMEFFIARKVRPVFEVYRQVFHKVAKHELSRKELALMVVQAEEEKERLMIANERQQATIEQQNATIKEQAPKVSYYEETLQSVNTLTTTQIAKEIGLDASKLNQRLKDAGVLFRQSGMWMLRQPYSSWNLAATRTQTYTRSDGSVGTSMYTVWNERGRRFIHALCDCEYNVRKACKLVAGAN